MNVIPFPSEDEVNLEPPSRAESIRNMAGILSATRPPSGNTEFQQLLMEATFESMTGHRIDATTLPFIDPATNAANLATRAEGFRMRMVHVMVLSALVLRPIPPVVSAQVAEYSRLLGIDDDLLRTVQQFAASDSALAAVDFERNGYTADWSEERSRALHTDASLAHGWDASENDPELASRWQALGDLPEGTLGRRVHQFYLARGFAFPGSPGSAPPLLAQHDWSTCSPATAPRSRPSWRCSRSSPGPTMTHAASRCWPWWSACSRPAISKPAPARSRPRRVSSRGRG